VSRLFYWFYSFFFFFYFKPLKKPITPLIISFNPEASNKVYIKTTGKKPKETLDYILTKYKEMGYFVNEAKMPVTYTTVEDDYNAMYKTELRTMKMLTVFAVLSLCLSVMGIFSMVSFMVEKRRKEIAIRRINGAETEDIIFLFIKNFAKQIGIACAIAIPASFLILFNWLQTYAFRTPLSWWIFVIVPVAVSLITAALIAVQVFFTTRQNPAEVIKME
jgi:putative ABC transport system permease protein